jgi:hypothetical protein
MEPVVMELVVMEPVVMELVVVELVGEVAGKRGSKPAVVPPVEAGMWAKSAMGVKSAVRVERTAGGRSRR